MPRTSRDGVPRTSRDGVPRTTGPQEEPLQLLTPIGAKPDPELEGLHDGQYERYPAFSPPPATAKDRAGMIEVEVCIVGAGPVGASLACLLAARGVSVACVDKRALPPMEHPDFDGRAYAVASGSRRDLLEPAGVWANLPLASEPIERIRVSDGKLGRPASPLFLQFEDWEAGAGPFGFMTEARSLRMALNRTLHAAGVKVIAPAEVSSEGVSEGRFGLRAGDHTVRARLVVAAEGRDSPLRRAARIPVTRIGYPQSGIVSAVAHERPHGREALEHFLPAGPFAQLPMASTEGAPNVSAIVWTEERARRSDDACRRSHLRPRDQAASGRTSGRGAADRASLALPAVGDARASLRR